MSRITSWFAQNSVAANLLMILIIAVGLLTASSVKQEVFPELALDIVTVTVPYPGGSPEEIESSIIEKIESEIESIEGIDRYTSTATENAGTVTIEIESSADKRRVYEDIKTRIDGITTFPGEAEEPIVRELVQRNFVLNVAVFGNGSEKTIKEIGEEVREELADLNEISLVELTGVRPYEISVEITEDTLRRFSITKEQVAARIRASSIDLPAGSIDTRGGRVVLRTLGQAKRGSQLEQIPIIGNPESGVIVRLGDIATIIDGFSDTDQVSKFNGQPAALVQVFRVGNQDAIAIASATRAYIAQKETALPDGIELAVWKDGSKILQGRLDTLINNGVSGFILVFLVLTIFLQFKLAFWVSIGIPVAFLGSLALMPQFDVSINLISLFAFILVLGILVDDAIVAGEAIYTRNRKGDVSPQQAAIEGIDSVSTPILFAVFTTIVAFLPAAFVPGAQGQIWIVIPVVVIAALIFSLVESLLILPAHLSHYEMGEPTGRRRKLNWFNAPGRAWGRFQRIFSDGLETFIEKVYQPTLRVCLRWRYATIAVGIGCLIVVISFVRAGVVKFIFFPALEADDIIALVRMPEGTPVSVTEAAVDRMTRAARELQDEYRETYDPVIIDGEEHTMIVNILTQVGQQDTRQGGPTPRGGGGSGSHLGSVTVELAPSEQRPPGLTASRIVSEWRARIGEITGAKEVSFNAELASAGAPINIEVSGKDLDQLRRAAADIRGALAGFEGVFDITDSFESANPQIEITALTPLAEAHGLTFVELSRQVRSAFYGSEAQRVQRGRDEVIVFVRYPEDLRQTVGDLERLKIRTPEREFSLDEVAVWRVGESFATITRVDGKRAVNVTADVDLAVNNPNEVIQTFTRVLGEESANGGPSSTASADSSSASIGSQGAEGQDAEPDFPALREIMKQYPGVTWTLEGEQRDQAETIGALLQGFFIAMIVIFALLAVPLKSYTQPILIMIAIPFGIIGAILGHMILGLSLSVLSVIGIVALAGVVVNASLVLIDFINRNKRDDSYSKEDAVMEGAMARFRPILLTSMTTFVGLTPIMLERSIQAQFLIPMAVSLAFGVVFSTFITLLLIPAAYLILEDVRRTGRQAKEGLANLYGLNEYEDDEPAGGRATRASQRFGGAHADSGRSRAVSRESQPFHLRDASGRSRTASGRWQPPSDE